MPQRPPSQNIPLGLASILIAIFLFTGMDASAKWLTQELPSNQISFLRNLIALPVVIAIVAGQLLYTSRKTKQPVTLASLKIRQWRLALFRGVLIAIAQFTFFSSLANLPLATATTIAYIAPALITAMSFFVLKEHVGVWRWSAVAVGFLGVLIIQRPFGDQAFSIWTVLPLVTAVCYACVFVLVKTFDEDVSSAVITLYAAVIATVASSLLLVFGVKPISAEMLPFVLLVGLFGGFGHFFLNIGFRLAPASVIAPFEYLGLVLAYIMSWLIWRELPEPIVWFGGSLIVVAGLVIIVREQIRARR